MQLKLYENEEVDYTVDFTTLNAVELCNVWGVVRYIHGLSTRQTQRMMALECGSVCHEVFAAVRWLDAMRYAQQWELSSDLLASEGNRLFGEARLDSVFDQMGGLDPKSDDSGKEFITHILYTSGYEEDDRDTRRTLFNMEIALLAYYDRWNFGRWRPWVGGVPIHGDMQTRLGIEIPLDLYIVTKHSIRIRFVGRMDGLAHDTTKRNWKVMISPGENKTAMRLGETWEAGMQMSHQITGYSIGANLLTGLPANNARAIGLSIPWPTDSERYHGYMSVACNKQQYHYDAWEVWFNDIVEKIDKYAGSPQDAPKYTHSCTRYFRPCSLIPLCDEEDFQAAFSELEYDPWSPLDRLSDSD